MEMNTKNEILVSGKTDLDKLQILVNYPSCIMGIIYIELNVK